MFVGETHRHNKLQMSRSRVTIRLNDGEASERHEGMIRQYVIKPGESPKSGKTLRFKDQEDWLRAHGKIPAHDLSSTQKEEIRECFKLLDADGSGALDVDELQMAFKVLSIPMSRNAILRLFQAYSGGVDEVDLKAFEKIMAASHAENSENKSEDDVRAKKDKHAVGNMLGGGGEGGSVPLPFSQVASAFKRKKLLELFMEGGAARQEILTNVEKEKKSNATNLFRLPTLRNRMSENADGHGVSKVVSRYFMLDKLEEMGEETWKGERGVLPSQAIHKALGRGKTWEKSQRKVMKYIEKGQGVSLNKAKTASVSAGELRDHGQMNMYKMSAEDKKYARAMEAKEAAEEEAAAAAERAELLRVGGATEAESAEGRGGGHASGAGQQQHLVSPSSIPKLPSLQRDGLSPGHVSSTSASSPTGGRGGRKHGGGGGGGGAGSKRGNGFVAGAVRNRTAATDPSPASGAGRGGTGAGANRRRAQVELAKSRKAKAIGEERSHRSDTRRRDKGRGHLRGAIGRVPSGVLHGLVQPGGGDGGGWNNGDDDDDEEAEGRGVRGGGGGGAMVASVARDRIQASFGQPSNLSGVSSNQMPAML